MALCNKCPSMSVKSLIYECILKTLWLIDKHLFQAIEQSGKFAQTSNFDNWLKVTLGITQFGIDKMN